MLRIIYGRAGSGKTSLCHEEMIESAHTEHGVERMLLVPEQYSFQSEKELLEKGGEAVAARCLTVSFKRLSYWLKNRYGIIQEKQLNTAGKHMVLWQIVNACHHELALYNQMEDAPAFISEISGLISECKRYEQPPGAFEKAIGSTDDVTIANKLHDFHILYKSYLEKSKSFTDPDDHLYDLADLIERHGLFADWRIWVDGFDGFTPAEYRVLLCIMQNAADMTIALCTDHLPKERPVQGELFYPVLNTWLRLKNMADKNGIELHTKASAHTTGKHRSLQMAHLEKNLFSSKSDQQSKSQNNVGLYIYENPYEEIWETAVSITKLVREQGYRYHDISVIVSDLPNYTSLVQAIFSQFDIPYFMDGKEPIEHNPLIGFIRSLFDIKLGYYRKESIFRMLKTGLTHIDQKDIDILENYALRYGIDGKRWVMEDDWEFAHQSEDERLMAVEDDVNVIKHAVMEDILAFFEKVTNPCDANTFFSHLVGFLEEYGVIERYELLIETMKENNELEMANRYRVTWHCLMDLMDHAVMVFEREPYAFDAYASIFEVALLGYESGTVPPAIEQVHVGSVARSMVHKVRSVFIIGANESVFPGMQTKEGIFSDQDRMWLQQKGIELAPDTLTHAFEAKYRTYRCVTLPNSTLTVSCTSSNASGKKMRPAYVFSLLKRCFDDLAIEGSVAVKTESAIQRIGTPQSTLQELARSIARARAGTPQDPNWQTVRQWYKKREKWRERLLLLEQAESMYYDPPALERSMITSLYGDPLKSSVSAMEQFASCPFAFFLRYGLRAKERAIARMDPLGIGVVSHSVLENFFRRLRHDKVALEDVTETMIRDMIDHEVTNATAGVWGQQIFERNRNQYLINRYKQTLCFTAQSLIRQLKKGVFVPIEDEVQFGTNQSFAPVVIDHSSMSAEFHGKIDRLDVFQDDHSAYLRVVDYKTGKRAFSMTDFLFGLQIQLPFYLYALLENKKSLQRLLGTDKIYPAGIFYYHIDRPTVKADYGTDEQMIAQMVHKALRMQGRVVDEKDVIEAMDRSFLQESDVIRVKKNKDGTYSKASEMMDREKFDRMLSYVTVVIKQCMERISKGDVRKQPIWKGQRKGCDYCAYKGLCGFDPAIEGYSYQFLANDIKEEDVWQIMKKRMDQEGKNDEMDE